LYFPGELERATDVAAPLFGVQLRLRICRNDARHTAMIKRQSMTPSAVADEFQGLVEAALRLSLPMQGNGDKALGPASCYDGLQEIAQQLSQQPRMVHLAMKF
jgi:hypothetical protein